jgi:hypothetical protein
LAGKYQKKVKGLGKPLYFEEKSENEKAFLPVSLVD